MPALEDVSFELRQGTVSGIVGHNGAGKTTLLLLIAGLKKLKHGSIEVLGSPPRSRKLISRVGILTDRLRFVPEFKVSEVVRTFSLMHRMPDKDALESFEAMDLLEHRDKYVRELSTGLRKRLGVAVAIMHKPELILLDEPFSGLDPQSVRTMTDAIQGWVKEGRTVVISSHDLPELQELIHDVVVMRERKVLATGAFLELLRESGLTPRVHIETTAGTRDVDPDHLESELVAVRKADEQIMRITTKGTTLADLYLHLHQDPDAGGKAG
ncbi:MAG TPA: ABC transporter ATP-binding protein [Actinomycetota bacterium]|nr:ABC transporter ATP-binding protein [Actinomycetota bacterium]